MGTGLGWLSNKI